MQSKRTSTGEMISTLCFIGVGFWTLGAAMDSPVPRAIILTLCSLACFAGAARHLIAGLLTRE